MSQIQIDTFRVGESNYNFLISDPGSRVAIAIDPLEAAPFVERLKRLDLTLKFIINTHGHPDHVAGNAELSEATGAKIAAPDHEGIQNIFRILKGGSRFKVDEIDMQIYAAPGHTAGHILLLVNDRHVIVGDTLFLGGCGNCKFGGNPDDLYQSLQMLSALPGSLKVYCGHEYALKNLEFGRQHEPDNAHIAARMAWVKASLKEGRAPITTLAEEKEHNVFLRARDKSTFIKLRELRNSF